MNIRFHLELDNSGGPAGAGPDAPKNYDALEILRVGDLIVFRIIGLNGRVVSSGTCDPIELERLTEILTYGESAT